MKAAILASFLFVCVATAQYAGYYEYRDETSCVGGSRLENVQVYNADKCFKPNQGTTYLPSIGYSMLTCNDTHLILTQYADADTACELPLSTEAYPRSSCDKETKWDCWTALPDLTDVDPLWQVSLEISYYKGKNCDANNLLEWTATGFEACSGNVKTFCDGQSIASELCDEGCESGCQRVDSFPSLESTCTTSSEENWGLQVSSGSQAQSAFPTCKGVQGHITSAADVAKVPSMWILGLLILMVLF